MAFQAPTMIYVYMVYIVPHTFEGYSLWTQFYYKLLCWFIMINGLSNYFLVILTDPSTSKIDMSKWYSQLHHIPGNPNQCTHETSNVDTDQEKSNRHSVYNMDATEGLEWKFCKKCNIFMPPRSHHCKYCDKCILKRDHHCNMVGNCVGYNNQRFFIVLTVYAMITGLLGAFFTLKYIYEAMWPSMYSWTDLILPITFLRCLFGSISVLQALLTLHVYLEIPFGIFGIMYFTLQMIHVIIGLTPHEVEKNLPLKNTYNLTKKMRAVFGTYWILNFVFPMVLFFKQTEDGIHWEHIKIDHNAKKQAKETNSEPSEQQQQA